MLRHIFHTTEHVFLPNGLVDANRKEPISIKKSQKGDAAWSTQKTIPSWDIDRDAHLHHFPANRAAKVCYALRAVPSSAHRCAL